MQLVISTLNVTQEPMVTDAVTPLNTHTHSLTTLHSLDTEIVVKQTTKKCNDAA
jgi:hypothetical protein